MIKEMEYFHFNYRKRKGIKNESKNLCRDANGREIS